MKKIVYSILFFFLLFIGSNYIKALEYGKATCVYKQGSTSYIFELTSDGQDTSMKFRLENPAVGIKYDNVDYSGIGKQVFYNQTENRFSCPSSIFYFSEYVSNKNRQITLSYKTNTKPGKELLYKDSSSIDYSTPGYNNPVFANEIISCTFTSTDNKYSISIKSDGKNTLEKILPSGYTMSGLSVDQSSAADFIVNGKLQCPSYFINCFNKQGEKYCNIKTSDNPNDEGKEDDTAEDLEEEMGKQNGNTYRGHLSNLKTPLNILSKAAMNFPLLIAGDSSAKLADLEFGDKFCSTTDCGGAENGEAATEKAIRAIADYCGTVYQSYASNKNTINSQRVDECIDFNRFYNRLIEEKIIQNMNSDCSFISQDLLDKLIFVLDIIKIAGPIIALGLGTVDFIKTVAAGDVEKEMKSTFKKFLTRIISAILLLIIPIIIAFLLDLFLGNTDAYNPDNPFCGLVNWEDLE